MADKPPMDSNGNRYGSLSLGSKAKAKSNPDKPRHNLEQYEKAEAVIIQYLAAHWSNLELLVGEEISSACVQGYSTGEVMLDLRLNQGKVIFSEELGAPIIKHRSNIATIALSFMNGKIKFFPKIFMNRPSLHEMAVAMSKLGVRYVEPSS